MNTNTDSNESEFNTPDEAFEFLLEEHMDDKRRAEWTKAFDKAKPASASKKDGVLRKLSFKIASVAAVMVLLIGAFWMFNERNGNTQLMAQNHIAETIVNLNYSDGTRAMEIESASTEIPENIQQKLADALLHEDYNQMLGIYRSVEKKSELPIRDKFYFAISLLKVEKEDKYKAIRLLDEVILNDEHLEVEALYFRGLANIAVGNNLESESDFKSVMKISNYKNDVIIKILDELKH